MTDVRLERVYNDPTAEDGYRILVDRLWPRGLSKDKIKVDHWAKAVAPSTELRKAWHGDPEQFQHYANLYIAELNQNDAVDELLEIIGTSRVVTFVFAAKNEQLNHAVVLREYLLGQLPQR